MRPSNCRFQVESDLQKKPVKLSCATVAKSRLFRIDSVELEFSNGEIRCFEQLIGAGSGAVVVVPMLDEKTLLLLEEYALGTDRYELGFVKGLIEPSESASTAALRELEEETGYTASKLTLLDQVTLMPAYSNFRSHIFLATGLSPCKRQGDEPEPLLQHHWPADQLDALHREPALTDARTHLALYLLERHLRPEFVS